MLRVDNKNESVKQPGLTFDEVQRLILHAGVMGWPVDGGPGFDP